MISDCLPAVAQEITAFFESQKNGAGRRAKGFDDLIEIAPETLAFLGLQSAVHSATQEHSENMYLVSLGERINIECLSAALKAADVMPGNLSGKRMWQKINLATKAADDNSLRDSWDKTRKMNAATPIRNAVMKTGFFKSHHLTSAKNGRPFTKIKMCFTDEAVKQLRETKERLSWMRPVFEPHLVEPKPWKNTTTGCYEDERLSSLVPLVRHAHHDQLMEIEHDCKLAALGGELPIYLKALNALQATPLCINSYVVDAVEWCWQQNKVFGKFPESEQLELPTLSTAWEDMSRDDRMLFTENAKAVKEKNLQVLNNHISMRNDLDAAREMAVADEFWLGWNFDFRQRVYPVAHFNYHRDDHVKAMFTLSNAKELNEDNLDWLFLHIANTADFDKISKESLEDRVEWARQRIPLLYEVGKDFAHYFDIWKDADKPFQFLAACREYYLYAEAKWQGKVYNSGLPIALDGTNSGVQHYAALTANEHDGSLVNLVPAKRPADIYQAVADKVNIALGESTEQLAQMWRDFGVTRSTVKRNVMTYCYSSKVYGMTEQLVTDLMDPLEYKRLNASIAVHPFGKTKLERKKAAGYLAKLSFAAVEKTITSAKEGMEYFQSVAAALAAEGKYVRWTTPTGFAVVQKYTRNESKKIFLSLYDSEVHRMKQGERTVSNPTNRIDTKKMINAIAPNIVHSLDASHLLYTVHVCHEQGVNDFFVIHDSFGTVAADTEVMFDTVRNVFVDMYAPGWCFFQDFDAEARSMLATDNAKALIKPIPKKGNLDIYQVAESDFCFS